MEIETKPLTVGKKRIRYTGVAETLGAEIGQTYGPDALLPSEKELARSYSVSLMTMRKALDVLEDRGLIKRYHGRGTVVADRLKTGEFAIVVRPDLLKAGASHFYSEVAALLSGRIYRYKNSNWFAKLHLGQQTDSGEDFPATLDILDNRVVKNLRGVFTFHPLHQIREALFQKNIPVVTFSKGYETQDVAVVQDIERFYREASHHLRMMGCKTVGFIWNHPDKPLRSEDRIDRVFAKCAIDAGLSVQERWMPAVTGDETERKGYDLFMKFWEEQDSHPDGIIVNDDVIASGVLRAVLHKQIRLPEQIRLVSYANKGVELPYHLSVTRYGFDVSVVADAAVEAMVKLVNGQNPESNRILVPGELIKGNTT